MLVVVKKAPAKKKDSLPLKKALEKNRRKPLRKAQKKHACLKQGLKKRNPFRK